MLRHKLIHVGWDVASAETRHFDFVGVRFAQIRIFAVGRDDSTEAFHLSEARILTARLTQNEALP